MANDAQREPGEAVRPAPAEDRAAEPSAEPSAEAENAEPVAEEGEAAEVGDGAAEKTAEEEPEKESARTATTEFRVPKVAAPSDEPSAEEGPSGEEKAAEEGEPTRTDAASLTRPDIAIRRRSAPTVLDTPMPADEDESAGEQASEESAERPAPDESGAAQDVLAEDAPDDSAAAEESAPAETEPREPAKPHVPRHAIPEPTTAVDEPSASPRPPGPWGAAMPQSAAPQPAPPQPAPPRPAPPQEGTQYPGPWNVALPQSPPRHAAPQAPAPAPGQDPPQQQVPQQTSWDVAMPQSRSSGQWAVPWDGEATAGPAAPSQAPGQAPSQAPGQPPGQPHAYGQAPQQAPAAAVPHAAEHRSRRGRRTLIIVVAALVLVAGVVTGQLVRPVPDPSVDLTLAASSHTFQGAAPALPWPAQGQSTVYVDGLGTMGSSGGAAPTPTASVAKVMTAYVYLRDHPLRTGEPGPVLTVSPQAAAQIPARKKRGESLLGVTANQRLTQRKALEAMMIISANDVAHELARWDAGTEQAFVAKMNAAARELGMTSTTYTDPSGYDSRTVSTAADQVKLLRAAMQVPAFAEVVNNRAYVPDDGGAARPGGNILLGQYGVVGGKTGYTDAAGGNFVFAARKRVSGVATLIVGAVMGQRSTSAMAAVTAGQQLVAGAEGALTAATLAPAGATVARVDDGLGGRTPLTAASPVTVVGWAGLTVPVGVEGDPPHQGDSGEQVGAVKAGAARIPLKLARPLDEPSPLKRLIRLG
ncbi:D-alanyl-D-alanine carboxypeptidase [Actinomadura fibrosa]|uniref:Serine hydrolase n=1 Tax=Actinomadura fibrosa TaxID=111802 RepID=A0ABW2Y3Y7_9ACTN|nr:serine hydrolase [Actinomadura fibrosa]